MKIDAEALIKGLSARASAIALDSEKLEAVLITAAAKLRGGDRFLREFLTDFKTLLRMLTAYVQGRYKDIPWTVLVGATAALLYFINPFDLIPDFFIVTGLLDDAAVIAFALSSMRSSLKEFLLWESSSASDQSQQNDDLP